MRKTFALYFVVLALVISGCNPFAAAPTQTPANTDQTTADQTNADQLVPPEEAAAQTGAIVRIEPASATLNVGETATLEIRIVDVTGLFAGDVTISFNPAVLQVQDADGNKDGIQVQPGSFPSPDFIPTNMADNTAGTAQYAVTQLAPAQPVDGEGVFFSLTVEAIANGSSDISVNTADLASGDGQPIAANLVGGQITVGDGGGGQPTTAPPTTDPGQPATETPIPPTVTPVPPTATTDPGQPPMTPTSTPTPGVTVIPPVTPTVPGMMTPTSTPPPAVTPVPPVTQLPPGATVGFCYRVQPGDTLFSLGQRFGVEYPIISRINQLYPPDHIYAHQALFIPTQVGRGPNFYIVQPGDTVAGIAEQCKLPLDFLRRVNNLGPMHSVVPGHALRIPMPPFPNPAMPPGFNNRPPGPGPCCDNCGPRPGPMPPPCRY